MGQNLTSILVLLSMGLVTVR